MGEIDKDVMIRAVEDEGKDRRREGGKERERNGGRWVMRYRNFECESMAVGVLEKARSRQKVEAKEEGA